MTHQSNIDHEPHHAASSTATLLTELQLYEHRPFLDEPDARPLPEERMIGIALADIFDALVSTFADTHLASANAATCCMIGSITSHSDGSPIADAMR